MVSFEYKENYTVADFVKIIAVLRGEGGCPWDREQTHESIRRNLLEEAYEVAEAIDEGDPLHLREELGDLLMQVIFHARIEQEQGGFDIDAVADAACKKLILRHPHVFGDTQVADSTEVLRNWDEIKRAEKEQKSTSDAIDSVAKSLPALWRAEKIQDKARKAGFDWPEVAGAMDKLGEELGELRDAVSCGSGFEEELGDVLFSAVNVARFLNVDPEDALQAACDKFSRRFRYVEEAAGARLADMTLEEMEALYQEGKSCEGRG